MVQDPAADTVSGPDGVAMQSCTTGQSCIVQKRGYPMNIKTIALAIGGACTLMAAGTAMAAMPDQASLQIPAASVETPAKASDTLKALLTVKPAKAELASTCADPWWEMSGWQALTCAYIRSRMK